MLRQQRAVLSGHAEDQRATQDIGHERADR
jgi:hypothetical protein